MPLEYLNEQIGAHFQTCLNNGEEKSKLLLCDAMSDEATEAAHLLERVGQRRADRVAIALRSPPQGDIFHIHRSSQYWLHGHQKVLHEHSFKVSRNRNSDPFDNVSVKTFFKTIKSVLIWHRTFEIRSARYTETVAFSTALSNAALVPCKATAPRFST